MTGKQFKAAREAMGLSVSQLADLLDVNRSTIFRIEQTECTRIMSLAMERLADRWRGIETHDGSMFPVLVATQPTDRLQRLAKAAFIDATNVWRIFGSKGGAEPLNFDPTHWKPLPTYPTGE